jgi:hypothetical protein
MFASMADFFQDFLHSICEGLCVYAQLEQGLGWKRVAILHRSFVFAVWGMKTAIEANCRSN